MIILLVVCLTTAVIFWLELTALILLEEKKKAKLKPEVDEPIPAFIEGPRCANCEDKVNTFTANRISMVIPVVGKDLPVSIYICERCMQNA